MINISFDARVNIAWLSFTLFRAKHDNVVFD